MKKVITYVLALGLTITLGGELCLASEVNTQNEVGQVVLENDEDVSVMENESAKPVDESSVDGEIEDAVDLPEREVIDAVDGALSVNETSMDLEMLGVEENNVGAAYTVEGSVIQVSATAGEDIAQTLDDALEEARDLATDTAPVTVKVPAGSYVLGDNLHIYSNTILDVTDVTLTCTSSKNMLISGTNGSYQGQANYNESVACSGYNGFKNIKILGGTWVGSSSNTSTIIRIAHATNVTLDGVTLTGGGCAHQIEVAAIDGFYVKNCVFKDFGKSVADDPDKQEALQLDIPCNSDVFKAVYQDGTVMKNVEITGCTFSNVPRGVGTHTSLNGAYHENIKINDNKFSEVTEEAIVGLNYYNCEIKNNEISNCGAGILFQYFKADTKSVYTTIFDGATTYSGSVRHDAKTTISSNKIITKYTATCDEVQGIKVYGVNLKKSSKGADGKSVPVANYYISGVTVTDNTITTAGHGIHMVDARECPVSNNKIVGKNFSSKDTNEGKYDGIFVATESKNVTVTNNKISGMSRNGIFVQEGAYISQAVENTITDNKGTGINFYKESGCTGEISNNVISKCAGGGIMVSTDSSTGNIVSNQITGISGDAGITIYKSSTAGKIKDNTITDLGKDADGKYCHGIKLTTSATTDEISGNKIQSSANGYAAGNGVLVYKDSKVKGSINANIVHKTSDMSISVSTSSSVSGDISSNVLSGADKSGIFVYKSSKVGGDIQKNDIGKVKETGIYITGTTTVKGGIISNRIASAGAKGIFVYDQSKKTTVGSIQDNVIKKAKSQAINISSTKNNLVISGNKLSGNSDNAIIIQPNTTKYTITIKKNTIKGNTKKAAIRAISGKIAVADNTISNVAYGVYADKGVKGSVYNNNYKSKVKTQLRLTGKSTKQTTSKVNVSSAKSSAKKKVTVKWKKASKVEGYEVQYSTSKDFSTGVKTKAIKGKKTSVTLTGLKSGKTYYVRVCSYKTVNGIKVYSNYGKTKQVKVK